MADSSKIVLDDKNNGEEIEIDPSVLEVIMGIAAEKWMELPKCTVTSSLESIAF